MRGVPALLALLWLLSGQAVGVELTFELPDRHRQCFYEWIERKTECTLEFQVRRLIASPRDLVVRALIDTIIYAIKNGVSAESICLLVIAAP